MCIMAEQDSKAAMREAVKTIIKFSQNSGSDGQEIQKGEIDRNRLWGNLALIIECLEVELRMDDKKLQGENPRPPAKRRHTESRAVIKMASLAKQCVSERDENDADGNSSSQGGNKRGSKSKGNESGNESGSESGNEGGSEGNKGSDNNKVNNNGNNNNNNNNNNNEIKNEHKGDNGVVIIKTEGDKKRKNDVGHDKKVGGGNENKKYKVEKREEKEDWSNSILDPEEDIKPIFKEKATSTKWKNLRNLTVGDYTKFFTRIDMCMLTASGLKRVARAMNQWMM